MIKNKDGTPDLRPKRKKMNAKHSSDDPNQKVKKKRKKHEQEVPSVTPDGAAEVQKNTIDKKKKTELITEICPETVYEGEEDLSPEERRALERKMKKILKKEKKKSLKEQGETLPKTDSAGPTAAQLALDYLTCWAENKDQWKFQKTRQTWLLQHMFDSEKILDDKFSVLLHYLEGLQGAAKDTTIQKALALVQQSGDSPASDVQQRAHRARQVIQLLS
ncbi:hypothetical protein WMY93_011031 [Mugilogobius chulae]|uniref:WKF domain-containing protein n=1 Tax=Mugilogobius chulae TaxID=88201 RepID=A0AAW0P921_9GOBI